jgi:hypothetical protein
VCESDWVDKGVVVDELVEVDKDVLLDELLDDVVELKVVSVENVVCNKLSLDEVLFVVEELFSFKFEVVVLELDSLLEVDKVLVVVVLDVLLVDCVDDVVLRVDNVHDIVLLVDCIAVVVDELGEVLLLDVVEDVRVVEVELGRTRGPSNSSPRVQMAPSKYPSNPVNSTDSLPQAKVGVDKLNKLRAP